MEDSKLKQELDDLSKQIKALQFIMEKDSEVYSVIVKESKELKV